MPDPPAPRPPRTFFHRDTVALARALLGQRLVRIHRGRRLAGTIIETEAYLGIRDAAAHTHRGRHTPRNRSMYRDGGTAYVYFIYGMHHCVNVVAGPEGTPEAVLIRALQPTEGQPTMHAHRPAARHHRDLCSGPARLCAALAIDRTLDGLDLLTDPRLFIEQLRQRTVPATAIAAGPRIGLTCGPPWSEIPLRFTLRQPADHPRR